MEDEHIPTQKGENECSYFDEEALDVLRLIQRLIRDQNYSLRQVEHALASGNIEIVKEFNYFQWLETGRNFEKLRNHLNERDKLSPEWA